VTLLVQIKTPYVATGNKNKFRATNTISCSKLAFDYFHVK